jgi:small subunit ribosomal protein S18
MAEEKEQKKDAPTLEEVFEDESLSEEARTSEVKGNYKKKRRHNVNLKCPLCEGGVNRVTYKDVYQLKKFTSVRGKIISTEKSGVCHKHQKQLTTAIKRARQMALLPYVAIDA